MTGWICVGCWRKQVDRITSEEADHSWEKLTHIGDCGTQLSGNRLRDLLSIHKFYALPDTGGTYFKLLLTAALAQKSRM